MKKSYELILIFMGCFLVVSSFCLLLNINDNINLKQQTVKTK